MPSPLPLSRPGKIICVGLNYRAHAAEAHLDVPAVPTLFAKHATSLIGPGDPIEIPATVSTQIDFEAELGVVIGRTVKDLDPSSALDAVAGYVCFNDVSARDVQRRDKQWTRGKSFNTFGPIGPRLVATDVVGDPGNLRISCRINGEVMQDASTADMVFSVPEILAFASCAATLEAGDLIATGTPSGVGAHRNPPRWLRPGDEVTVEIERVGALTNPVVASGACA